MTYELIEKIYDYIDEYNTHQPEAKRPALSRLLKRTQPNVLGNESKTNHKQKKQIL